MAAIAEMHSPHPIARSIVEYFPGKLPTEKLATVKEVVGQGIKAVFADQELLVGKKALLNEHGIALAELPTTTTGTLVYVAYAGKYLGCLEIADTLKQTSATTLKELKKQGIKTVMLTGDRQKTADAIASKLAIDTVKAELLPQDKLTEVEKLQQAQTSKVGFVGDGLNDTPVLARADVGIAMGGLGSDAAIEAADVVLMRDDPAAILRVLNIARWTKKIVWQNICLALGIKFVFLILGAFGDVTMWEAVFADVGVTLIAVLNALRIMRK